jgi:hypothetical protein
MASRSDLRARERRPGPGLPDRGLLATHTARLDRPWLPWALLALLLVAGGAFLYRSGHDQIFWYDEWEFLLGRRGHSLSTFLEPHNEHLSLVPVLVYKLLLATTGMDGYGPYRLVLVVLDVLCAGLLFVYAQRRVSPWLALGAAALFMLLGPAWEVILWPFQIAWVAALASGLGALLFLDRGDRMGEVAASVLLLVALASTGLGVAIAGGVLVEVLWRSDRLRRLWIPVIPLLFYAAWYVGYSESHFSRRTLPDVPAFVADAAAASMSSLVGLAGPIIPQSQSSLSWGRPLAVLAVVALVWRITRMGTLSPRVAMLLASLVGFWILTAVGRAGFAFTPPYSSRYVYVGGAFALLIAIELLRGVAIGRTAAILLGAALVVALVANVGALRDASRYLRERSAIRAANLGAIEIARDTIDPGFSTAPFITAGAYLAAAADDGSPAFSPAQIAVASEDARASADDNIVKIHKVTLAPGGKAAVSGPPPAVDGASGGAVKSSGPCVTLTPSVYRSALLRPGLDVVVPAGGLTLRATGGPVDLFLRRFATAFPPAPFGTVTPGGRATLRIPGDRATLPWHLHMAPAGRVSACVLGGRSR